ncbi:MAG: 50S ribosomal protein L21 [Omnitrophica WOR_2 bacterium RIFCSPLOWO2_12_FULL_51_8]|nr:MAG: 50S ribosomal protein L21 [Omnitrophica WOR_2 bacterium RIFCSPLOWO2_12_FULL_51_8]
MYAIIEVGAKQYYVEKNDIIEVERFSAGKEIVLDKVLLVSNDKQAEVGQPYLKGAKVHALVLGHILGEKSVAFKYRRRKSSHWKKGHRQQLVRLKIKDIELIQTK